MCPYFVLVYYIVVQTLVKTFPRRVYNICLFLFSLGMQLFKLIKQEVKHSYYNLLIKGEKYQLDLSKLLMS